MANTYNLEILKLEVKLLEDFDDLTEEQVKGWVENEVDFNKFRKYLDSIIEEKINPPTEAKDVPW